MTVHSPSHTLADELLGPNGLAVATIHPDGSPRVTTVNHVGKGLRIWPGMLLISIVAHTVFVIDYILGLGHTDVFPPPVEELI
ncbi:MAG: hypothetical protein ACXWC4_08655 [Telluria sp.]